MWRYLGSRIVDEPVAFGSLVRICLLAAMAFGLAWTPQQLAAVMAVVEGLVTFLTRKVVTPNTTVNANLALAKAANVRNES